VRTSYLANIDGQTALDNFVTKSRDVENLIDPLHETQRHTEHEADWSRDVAIETCKYIVEYGILAVTASSSAMAEAVTNREVLHATGLVKRSKEYSENAVRIVMTLGNEIERYMMIDSIQKRTLRAEIVIQLQKEQEARMAGNMEAVEDAIAAKDAALTKLIELYNEE
jgi:hypothetical protein